MTISPLEIVLFYWFRPIQNKLLTYMTFVCCSLDLFLLYSRVLVYCGWRSIISRRSTAAPTSAFPKFPQVQVHARYRLFPACIVRVAVREQNFEGCPTCSVIFKTNLILCFKFSSVLSRVILIPWNRLWLYWFQGIKRFVYTNLFLVLPMW